MAIFTNQATLTYTGGSTNSNIAVGEILEVLSADKTAVSGTYAPGELVTYVITIRNTGSHGCISIKDLRDWKIIYHELRRKGHTPADGIEVTIQYAVK